MTDARPDAPVMPAADAVEKALQQTWLMIDPFKPPGAPGSYARGEHSGIIAALCTFRENLDRALAAAPAEGVQPVAPAGWKLVPAEPSFEMKEAALAASRAEGKVSPEAGPALPEGYELWSAGFVYRAMLAAAPTPPQAEAAGVPD